MFSDSRQFMARTDNLSSAKLMFSFDSSSASPPPEEPRAGE
jgi:hypothetical protein